MSNCLGYARRRRADGGDTAPRAAARRALIVAVVLLAASRSMALQCPAPQPPGAPDAIQETPAQISELSGLLASGDLGNRVPVFIRELRGRHPNAPAGELVNYLVTAYCPIVNAMTGLGDAEKQAKMDSFASQVAQAAW